jgi:phage gpG-like protein
MAKKKQIDFDKINAALDRLAETLPRRAGVYMLNHSKKAFRDQGFTDDSLSPWAKRTTKNAADIRTGKTRAILFDSGNLRKSIIKRKETFEEVAVGSYGIKYAARHNRGLKGMPERKFVGKSRVLNKKLTDLCFKEFKKALEA